MTLAAEFHDIALEQFSVSRETLTKIDKVLNVLDEWRLRSNLIGPREWEHIWPRHVLDCLQLTTHLSGAERIVDFGSGAGFPGLILACQSNPDLGGHVTLIESIGKKCRYLDAAIDAAQLPATVLNERLEDVAPRSVDILTARAFAPLPKLLDYASPWFKKGGIGLFHKGQRWEEELTQAQEKWTLAYQAIPSRIEGSGVILKIMEAKRAR